MRWGVCRRTDTRALEVFAQKSEAFGDTFGGVFFSFEFEGDPTGVVHMGENGRDAGIVDVERVPATTAEVGFGLDERGAWGDFFELRIHVVEEVSGIENGLEPRGIDGVEYTEEAVGGAAESPVIFQS